MASVFSLFEDQIGKETTEEQMQLKKLFLKMSEDDRMDDFLDAMLDDTVLEKLMMEME